MTPTALRLDTHGTKEKSPDRHRGLREGLCSANIKYTWSVPNAIKIPQPTFIQSI